MTASQLIAQFQDLMALHGDLPVMIPAERPNPGAEIQAHGICITEDTDTDKIQSFMICDQDTYEAYL